MSQLEGLEKVQVEPAALRALAEQGLKPSAWLDANHSLDRGVWPVTYKKHLPERKCRLRGYSTNLSASDEPMESVASWTMIAVQLIRLVALSTGSRAARTAPLVSSHKRA